MMKKRTKKVVVALMGLVLMLAAACAVYIEDYYHADAEILAAWAPAVGCTVEQTLDGNYVVRPAEVKAGLIFYPGGKVEHAAYLPLMQACVEKGILCVLVEMPMRLAVLDVDAAAGITESYPEVEHWYIGGHSLGGSMAASYAADNAEAFEGVILLGAYSTANLRDRGLTVLSVYGSEDKVLNAEKYAQYRENLPDNFTELVLQGGCHALFGAYGPQDGDGTPTVSLNEQVTMTAAAIAAHCI